MPDWLDALVASDPTEDDLRAIVSALGPDQFVEAREGALQEMGVSGSYAFEPVRYVREGLREGLWSGQQLVLESVRDNVRTAVAAGFAVGKTHLAARIVSWWCESWPLGTAGVVTTATSFRSVKGQLWGQIRRLHKRHALQGRVNLTEWWVGQEQIALGFSASDTDPESVQGWHWPHTLVIVDEAGGISDSIGRALEGLMSSGHARMLAIGNPSMDVQDSWFERICSSEAWNLVRLDAASSPNFTGEDAGPCRTCPSSSPPHSVSLHLVNRSWVEATIAEYGKDDPYVVSRVFAQFPEIVANVTIPKGWVEDAARPDAVVDHGNVVALGVDVAADGGDELAIGRREGFVLRLVHHSRGKHLANSVDAAGIVLDAIKEAEALAATMGYEAPVRVKVDVIGVGLGVCSVLEKWGEDGEQRHHSEIVRVNVGARAGDPEAYSNCLTGDSLVVPIGGLRRVYRSRHDGPLYRVKMASGDEFTATPNHNVLTPAGWVPVHALAVGYKLCDARDGVGVGPVDPGVRHMPTPIGEIYRSASVLGVAEWVLPGSVNFHGDLPVGEVEVVTAHGYLHAGHPLSRETSYQHSLDRSLLGPRPFACQSVDAEQVLVEGGDRRRVQFGNVRSAGSEAVPSDAVLGGYAIMEKPDGFAYRSQAYASFGKRQRYDALLKAHGPTEAFDGLSSLVASDQFIDYLTGRPEQCIGFGLGPWRDAALGEDAANDVRVGAVPPAESVYGLSVQVPLDEVVAIDVVSPRGHRGSWVYTLETTTGAYRSASVIQRNCKAEMYWAGRKAFEPNPEREDRSEFRLDVDATTRKQLSAATYGRSATGKLVIESKAALRKRGQKSPDRGEAILLALYEPVDDEYKVEVIL